MFDSTIISAVIATLTAFAVVLIPIVIKRREIARAQQVNESETVSRSDLRISPLTGFLRLQSLDGRPAIELAEQTVYCGGCKVEFELSHNGIDQEPISLLGLVPIIADFDASTHKELEYLVDGDNLHPAGTARVHEFRITIIDGVAQPAKWILDAKKGLFEISSSAANMLNVTAFDTTGSNQFKFLYGDADANTLRGSVLVFGIGLFMLSFKFVYSVGGTEREHISEAVWLYNGN